MDRQMLDYFPPILAQLRDVKGLSAAYQLLMDALWEKYDAILQNQVVSTMQESGIKRMEQLYGITPKDTTDLEFRRFELLARISETPPYTIKWLDNILSYLCEGDYLLNRDLTEQSLTVKIGLTHKEQLETVTALLNRVVPCNMGIHIDYLYNTYEMLGKYTYEELEAFTYQQLKEDEKIHG